MASAIGNIDANALSSNIDLSRIVIHQQQQQHKQMQHLCIEPEPQFPCHERMMQYQYQIRLRPCEHNIAYWREFVSQYYVPGARKRWCMSSYENLGEHSLSVISRTSMETRNCDICDSNWWKGLEANFEVLPRLLKTQFESGIIDELLYLNSPHEFRLPSGVMVLTYAKAVEESVYEQFRVVRDGQLQILFRDDFKILSWDFCARQHEVFVSRSSIAPKVNQLVQTADQYTRSIAATVDSRMSPQDLLSDCNRFVMEGLQLTMSLELPLVDDLGFSKSFVRCLQTAEVANSMKDLMQLSHCNNIGAIESLQMYCQKGDPTGMGKSISDSTSNNPERYIPNQSSSGNCPMMSSPFPSPHLQSPGPRKVQGSPFRDFLVSQLSQTNNNTANLEENVEGFEEIDRNAATNPPADARELQQIPAASSSYYSPHLFNAMDWEAILNMDMGDGTLENDSQRHD